MRKAFAFVFALLCLFGCTGSNNAPLSRGLTNDAIDLYMIDVGQADAIVLTSGDQVVIIDGGNVADGQRMVDVLSTLGIEHIDTMVATHPHEDHIGGLQAILDEYPVDQVVTPVMEYESECFEIFMALVHSNGSEVIQPSFGQTIDFNGATLTFYDYPQFSDITNNLSIITQLNNGDTMAYFMGDAQVEVEQALLKDHVIHPADLIKIGHHGSYTSTSASLIDAMDPTIALISCGLDNEYGFPHEEPLAILNDHDVTIYRTDLDGDIHCVLDNDGTYCEPTTMFSPSIEKYDAPTIDDSDHYYIGNIHSHVVHDPSCANLPALKNQIIFESLDDAYTYGYHACQNCLGQ